MSAATLAGTVAALKNGMRPVHPGEVLAADFMEPLGLSSNRLAKRTDRSYSESWRPALTRLVAYVLDVPISLVSLVETDRQWFKARHGLDAPELPRETSFCGHVVATDGPLIVPDARDDPRFFDNPLVTGADRIRFYAGFPLRTPGGFPRRRGAPQIDTMRITPS